MNGLFEGGHRDGNTVARYYQKILNGRSPPSNKGANSWLVGLPDIEDARRQWGGGTIGWRTPQ